MSTQLYSGKPNSLWQLSFMNSRYAMQEPQAEMTMLTMDRSSPVAQRLSCMMPE